MKHIQIAMDRLSVENSEEKNPENVSILEKILRQTKDPKLATVLALDLMLVGVDTVSWLEKIRSINKQRMSEWIHINNFFLFFIRHLSLQHR